MDTSWTLTPAHRSASHMPLRWFEKACYLRP